MIFKNIYFQFYHIQDFLIQIPEQQPKQKKTQFQKSLEILGLKEDREYTKAQESIMNMYAKKIPAQQQQYIPQILKNTFDNNYTQKQAEAGVFWLQHNTYNEEQFLKACGVGVTYTDEEIDQFVANLIKEQPQLQNYQVLSTTSKQFQFAESQRIKKFVDKYTANRVVEKVDKKQQKKEEKKDDEFQMKTLQEIFKIIPEKNRYPQTPENQAKHEEYLKSIGAKVLTRAPPEPSFYLHIGHAKAFFIDFNYAKLNGGKCILRLDDTNPSHEKEDYVQSIIETIKWLGHDIYKITYASDYFDKLYEVAEQMILEGKCYVDNQNKEQIQYYRDNHLDPPCRNRPPKESLRLFREMKMGLYPEGALTLRMKIDMKADNPNLWDPIAYRIKYVSHQKAGNKWCIYPSYDFTHCLCDSFENITHSLCTLEFNIRRESYDWLTRTAGVYRPMQWEFSRLNITHTMLSKRKLIKIMDMGVIHTFNDPRLPTLVGFKRKGYTPSIINNFCQLIGVSRNDQLISLDLLEHVARQEFEKTADRAMAVLDPLRIELVDVDPRNPKEIEYPLHPLDKLRGTEKLHLGKIIYIDRAAFLNGKATKEWLQLALDQPVALRYGPLLFVKEVVTDKKGNVICVKCTHDWSQEKKQELFVQYKKEKKTMLHIHWISEMDSKQIKVNLYDNLFTCEDCSDMGDDWLKYVNKNSLIVKSNVRVPNYVWKKCCTGKEDTKNNNYKVYQFERIGFFVVDEDSTEKDPIMNRTVALKQYYDKE